MPNYASSHTRHAHPMSGDHVDAETAKLCQQLADKDETYQPRIVQRGGVHYLTTKAGVKKGDAVLWRPKVRRKKKTPTLPTVVQDGPIYITLRMPKTTGITNTDMQA